MRLNLHLGFLGCWLLVWVFTTIGYSQPRVILLQNPSLEDKPSFSRTPQGWFYCGEIGESPPDVHPLDLFGVALPPKHGHTYVGMVVRDNGTWEGLSQWLSEPLQTGQCYELSIYAARSVQYQSLSRITWQLTNYDRAVVLRIWGGNLNCEKTELLAVSTPIETIDWQRIQLSFRPTQPYNRLVIEAFYANSATPYCGNVLIDHVSPLVPVHCDSGQPAIAIDTLKNIQNTSDLDLFLATVSPKITFSDVNEQPIQHVFFLPSGELEQANRPLYELVQGVKNNFNKKLIFHIVEEDKKRFHAKFDKLEKELELLGLTQQQFRVLQYRNRKGKSAPKLDVLIEVE